jgi:hypothetical protein
VAAHTLYSGMADHRVELLLGALSASEGTYVLGAGASAPHVPTIGQIPDRIAPFGTRLGSLSVGPIPDSPLRRLIAPLIEKSRYATTMVDFLSGALNSATIAVILEDWIAQAHWMRLPQYNVFGLLPTRASVVSFNWDGLAFAHCPQSTVLHPHGAMRPRRLLPTDLAEALDWSEMDDSLGFRPWLLPGLVMPGEEEGPALHDVRERVLNLWLAARHAIIIGYSFGLGSGLDYDKIWLDTFVEAFARNPAAPIHIVSPDADELRGELTEQLHRSLNIHSWPFSWYALSSALLLRTQELGARDLNALLQHPQSVLDLYNQRLELAAV